MFEEQGCGGAHRSGLVLYEVFTEEGREGRFVHTLVTAICFVHCNAVGSRHSTQIFSSDFPTFFCVTAARAATVQVRRAAPRRKQVHMN